MRILAIDTSCDETAAAVTEDTKVLSNVVWSQASSHAKFGSVMPSLAQRMHEERIDWVIEKALKSAFPRYTLYDILHSKVDAIAVTIGPGLSIALGVGIDRAKMLAKKYKKPLIAVNHVEAHLLSPLARPNNSQLTINNLQFPSYGLCVSGGNTIFVLIEKVGRYKVLAQTQDDALGEALDKGARMLGLGYPGGAILEKMAHSSRFAPSGQARLNPHKLPVPLVGQEKRQIFSYSGLKTSFYRLIQSDPPKSKQDIYNLAAVYQDVAFRHIESVISYCIEQNKFRIEQLLLGGGVAANVELRKRLRKLGRKHGFNLFIPYSLKICGDNAAMIGVAASLNLKVVEPDKIDRVPNLKI